MSNLEVETARKLDITSKGSSCGGRRYRSYSASVQRGSNDDYGKRHSSWAAKKGGPQRWDGAGAASVNNSQSCGGGGGGTANDRGSHLKRRHGSFCAGGGGGGGGGSAGFFKRRRKDAGIVPPTKFLLGGNINDPLNLSSFADESGRSPSQSTPACSPLPPLPRSRTEVEVLIPRNINDPLNLNASEEDAELNLLSPVSKKRKRKNRKKKMGSDCEAGVEASSRATDAREGEDKTAVEPGQDSARHSGAGTSSAVHFQTPHHHHHHHRNKKADDKIVSPVIPQPGARRHRPNVRPWDVAASSGSVPQLASGSAQCVSTADSKHGMRKRSKASLPAAAAAPPKFRARGADFCYGNYSRYYGYRNPGRTEDGRLSCLKREWFEGKDVLDIGCNTGHITLTVARDLVPAKIVGIDIDSKLIKAARRNICHYMSDRTGPQERAFPISFSICCGPIITATVGVEGNHDFPNNVCFVEGNYVLESDELLEMQQPAFDAILCLSLTKWVHLNWGDDGIKRLFKRIYQQLRPGGRLILEPQAFSTYGKRKNLTETTYKNYHNITLRPDQFTEYLLSKEVGFSKCEAIGTAFNVSKGFQRPMQLFTKGENSPTHVPEAAAALESSS